MASFTLESVPKLITADLTERKTLTNAGGDRMLLGDEAVAERVSDVVLDPGESQELEAATWIISEGQTQVAISTVALGAEHEAAIRSLQAEVAELKGS